MPVYLVLGGVMFILVLLLAGTWHFTRCMVWMVYRGLLMT